MYNQDLDQFSNFIVTPQLPLAVSNAKTKNHNLVLSNSKKKKNLVLSKTKFCNLPTKIEAST